MPKAWMLGISLMIMGSATATEAKNLGHRVGAGPKEYHKSLPENSISALKAALVGHGKSVITPLQYHANFDYMEFDVQETKDNRLVLFHDNDLVRMLPQNERNKGAIAKLLTELNKNDMLAKAYKDLRIKDLTLDQLQTLSFDTEDFESVPTLEEFLTMASVFGLERPMAVEIKYIHSDEARQRLIDLVADFRDAHLLRWDIEKSPRYDMAKSGIGFLAFKKNFKKSFGKRKSKMWRYWCGQFREAGFEKVFQTIFHFNDLCD